MSLYIIRHGETYGNVDRVMDGIRDVELTDKGREQAINARSELMGIDFDLVFCSPLKRARDTMELATKNMFPVIIEDRIIERDCGEFMGLPLEALDRPWYWNYHNKTKYEKAESIDEFFGRVYAFLDEIKEKYRDKNILLVTHSGVSKATKCYFEGVPEDGELIKLGLKNCEVKKYEWK